jgi:hypothetical protein
LKVVHRQRLPRRRDGLQQPSEIRAERDKLDFYVKHDAKNRRLQLMAFGAKTALDWVLDNRQGMASTRLLNLTEFALKLEKRSPVTLVPRVVNRAEKGGARP